MADTIAQAVLSRFANAGLTDFIASGGLWLDEIPAGKTLPWCAFTMAEESPCEYTMEREYFERGGLDFFIFAVTPAEAERLALLVKAAFDACVKRPDLLVIANANVVEWERTGYKIGVEDLLDKQQRQVGLASLSYGYAVQRMLPA